MSLGTDQGFLMSPELLRVAERAQHDPQSGGRHPGILTPDQDQGVVLRGRCLPRRLVTVPTSFGASSGSTTRFSDGYCVSDPETAEAGLGRCETASTEEPSGGNLLARI